MGDVVSTHLDEGKREMITACTRRVMAEFGGVYQQQYAVALFNSVRYEIEGGTNVHSQLLHRKNPLQDKSIFSGDLFHYMDENKKWRNRFFYVADSYNIHFYDSKLAHERGIHPKGVINCAGYKALNSMDEYLELLNSCMPDTKVKPDNSPYLRCASNFLLILWHPYARHHYFNVRTEKEQRKWLAVFQDCIRHANNGLSEENNVQTPAFTDSVRLYRQSKGHYGTWDMMCGDPPRILANLVMETLLPDLKKVIGPRLKGKLQQKQRNWMLISDAVYRQVLAHTQAQHGALVQACEVERPRLDAALRTDMDQIVASKEHVTGRMRAMVLPQAEQFCKAGVQPYTSSILEALMDPVGRGFSEVREVLFVELVEISKNTVNDEGRAALGTHMEKLSMLAFHPVKMQSCYYNMEQLSLEGLQQRFDVSSSSVFIQRGQILMREQMDNGVYTFEQLLHQSLEDQSEEQLHKTIQCCQERVLKKYDYDSSSVRKKFFREALLQIIIPHMLKHLYPVYSAELPKFEELIFEDFSRFILVENIFEEVVLQSVSKDIMMAVKEAAVQRRHNLYRDSIVLTNSDPNLHLLEGDTVDWAGQYGGGGDREERKRNRRQIVSMIRPDGLSSVPYGSCLEVPGVEEIPEENEAQMGEDLREQPLADTDDLQNQLDEEDTVINTETLAGQLEESVSTSDVLQRQLKEPVSTSGVLQRQLEEPVSSSDVLQRQLKEPVSTSGVLQRQLEEPVSSSDVLQRQLKEPVSSSDVLQRQLDSPVSTTEVLQRQVLQEPPISPVEPKTPETPSSPDNVLEIRHLINPVLEMVLPSTEDAVLTNGTLPLEEGDEIQEITIVNELMPRDAAIASALQELDNAVKDEDYDVDSDEELGQEQHDDSGFQSPTNEAHENGDAVDTEQVEVTLEQERKESGGK